MIKIRQIIHRLRPHATRASWAVAEQAVNPLIMIALTPFLLKHLGVDQFGLWMLVMAVVGMGQLTSLGAGTATIKHVSADLAVDKREDAVATIRAAVTIVLIWGGMACLLVAVVAPFIAQIFFSKMGQPALVSQMLVLGVVLMFVQEIDNVFASALRGAQRFDLSAKVEFFTRLVWAFGVAALAWHYRSLIAVLSGVFLLSFIKGSIKAHLVNHIFSVSNCYKPIFERTHLKRVVNFGKWIWIQSIGGVLWSVADRLLIGAMFGAADLARYSICLQLAQYVHAIPAVGMQVIFPWLSAKVERGESTKHFHLSKYALYGGSLCLLLPIALFILSPTILTVWLGKEFYVNNIELARILIFAYGLLAFNVPAHFFLMGLGKAKFLSITNLIAGTASVLASLYLAPLGLVWFAVSKLLYGPIIFFNFLKLRDVVMKKNFIDAIKVKACSFRYKNNKSVVVQAGYMGCQILVRANEDVGVQILAGTFEKSDLIYLLSKLRDDDVFFDIGANIGLFSLAVAKKNQTINVHAFEPIPLNACLFEAALHLNCLDSVRLNRTCVGDFQGEVEFSLAADSAYSSIHDTGRKAEIKKLNVPITTLDKYFENNLLKRVDIIKVDVEGAENLVLDGAKGIFSNTLVKPRLVLMELNDKNFAPFHTSIKSIVKKMEENEYEAFVLKKGQKIMFQEEHYNKVENVFFECINSIK